MLTLSSDLLNRLDIGSAIEAETAHDRQHVPPEPWRDAIASNKTSAAKWFRSRLEAGVPMSVGSPVAARKVSGKGTRPILVMGILERVALRALTDLILSGQEIPSRDPNAYRRFVQAPAWDYFLKGIASDPSGNAQPIEYVVGADIAAFYEYIDHGLLREELDVRTGEVDAVDALVGLLGEVEGRDFGLPQLIEPSDRLSEVYIQVVERDLVRSGFLVWRYNDDFRIGVPDYSSALAALERLDHASRAVGLSVSDGKTKTWRAETYFEMIVGKEINQVAPDADLDDLIPDSSPYEETGNEETLEFARDVIARIGAGDGGVNIDDAEAHDIALLRAALTAFTTNLSPDALDFVVTLFRRVPPLTPHIARYLVAMHAVDAARIGRLVGFFIRAPMTDWQGVWISWLMREVGLARTDARLAWLRAQRRTQTPLLGAEASLTLAAVGAIDFRELDRGLRECPAALQPWYLRAMAHLSEGQGATQQALQAIRGISPQHSWLVQ